MIKYNNDVPIYLQIMEFIKKDIISGKYPSGSKIPSVRELALKYRVNPNTCQKALSELTNLKFLNAESTSGRYVSQDVNFIDDHKNDTINNLVESFLKELKDNGISIEEALTLLKEKTKYESNSNK